MKFDFLTSLCVALGGFVVAFFLTNLMVPELEPYEFNVISKAQDQGSGDEAYDYASLVPPNNEIFNYNALNPTVEVYVGDCQSIDENGNCIEEIDKCELTDSEGNCLCKKLDEKGNCLCQEVDEEGNCLCENVDEEGNCLDTPSDEDTPGEEDNPEYNDNGGEPESE